MEKEALISRILECSVTLSSRGDPHHLKSIPLLFTRVQTRGFLEVVLLRENTHISVCALTVLMLKFYLTICL